MAEMTDSAFLIRQYQSDQALKTRISLYEYGQNQQPWHDWVFSQLRLKPNMRILELGCGSGHLWAGRLAEVPDGCEVLLTDRSPGMVAAAERLLGHQRNIGFGVIDAENPSLPMQSWDYVIANHMLYHVGQLDQALDSIRRLLKPGGTLAATTNGSGHLREINGLITQLGCKVERFDTEPDRFNGGNGYRILAKHFGNVRRVDRTDVLRIPTAQPLIDYILSIYTGVQYPDLSGYTSEIQELIERQVARDGAFTVHTNACFFEAVL